MKAGELREFDEDELRRKAEELKDQLFKLRFQHELGQLENSDKLRMVRRDIARIETVLKELRSKGKD
jgi:large subunit ribosomal protein L29